MEDTQPEWCKASKVPLLSLLNAAKNDYTYLWKSQNLSAGKATWLLMNFFFWSPAQNYGGTLYKIAKQFYNLSVFGRFVASEQNL